MSTSLEIRRGGKYLTFMLGAEGFGIPIRKVREIIGMMDITAIPRTPTHIKGVINLRGQVIEVIDLRAQFGLPETARTEATCIIVVKTSSRGRSTSIGLIVDCVSEVLNIADESIEDAPSFGMSVDSNFILGMAKAGQNVKVLLDIERIHSTDGAGPVANSSSATTATAIIALTLLGLSSTSAPAGRPLVIDDAAPIPHEVWQLELGAGYVKSGGTNHYDVPVALSYGIYPRLAIGIGFGGQYETSDANSASTGISRSISDVRDLTFGAKWQLNQAQAGQPLFGLAGTAKVPVADDDDGMGSGHADFDLTFLVTHQIGRTHFDANIGYTIRRGDSIVDEIHYGLAARHPLTETVNWVSEVYFVNPVEDHSFSAAWDTGLQVRIAPNWVLDASVGTGLTSNAPDLTARVGLTVRF